METQEDWIAWAIWEMPEASDRKIARIVGCRNKEVKRIRQRLEKAPNDQPSRTTGQITVEDFSSQTQRMIEDTENFIKSMGWMNNSDEMLVLRHFILHARLLRGMLDGYRESRKRATSQVRPLLSGAPEISDSQIDSMRGRQYVEYYIEIEVTTHTIKQLDVELLVGHIADRLNDKPDKTNVYRKSQIGPLYFGILFKRKFWRKLEALEYAREKEEIILKECKTEGHGKAHLISDEDIDTTVKTR